MIWTRASDYVFWKMNHGSRRQRGIGREKKRGWCQRSFVLDEIQSTIDHVLLHELTMREVGLQAHLQGFNTTDTYNITTVHSSSTSEERNVIILCTVYCSTCWLITVELICSQVALTCTLFLRNWETAVCGGREVFFQKTEKLLEHIRYYQYCNATWQRMLN